VPANVPFALSILDANGHRLGGRHRQWITLKAGENLECHGCHERNSQLPHGRLSAQAPSINLGASGGFPFTNANVNIIAMQGQTMAEAEAMVNGLAELTADLNYEDIWTDTNKSQINPSVNFTYKLLESQAPNGSECFDNWTAYCRIQINYVEHIQPLWQLPRQVFDANTAVLLKDDTCTSCHTPLDENNLAQVPAGQLDLSATVSSDQPAHLTSYRELFFNDVEQEVIEGILVDKRIEQLDENLKFLRHANIGGEFMNEADQQRVRTIGQERISIAGQECNFLTQDEVTNLSIDKGTLTPEERAIINNHIVVTIEMLKTLPFPRHLKNVPEFAGGHHEKMDGTGYPNGLKGEQMSVQARIMAIADIFEALTAVDRPYKEGKKLSEALRILGFMSKDRHIDPELFKLFIDRQLYLKYAADYLEPSQIDEVDPKKIPGYMDN
ncbi:MAG: HD domain-containing protein, partial [Gammaproteobacteria bacterium]|nr:HD domain-containing protein [Gammaproteobacteria bacterium]